MPQQQPTKPLVEIASDETVLRALAQSAHPVEFIDSSGRSEVPEAQHGAAEPERS